MSEQGTSFEVRFTANTRNALIPPNSLGLYGKGRLQLAGHQLVVSGKRHRLFRTGVPVTHTFRMVDVANVDSGGRLVRFDVIRPAPEKNVVLGFEAGSEAEAEQAAVALGRKTTPSFALSKAEWQAFHEQLDATGNRTPVTLALVAVNVLVFALMVWAGASVAHGDPGLAMLWGSNIGALTLGGQWWRLLTSAFIHFGLFHLFVNMASLLQGGQLVERMFGPLRFLLIYLCSAIGGSLLSLWWHPVVNSAGASGAVFGVFGALLAFILKPQNKVQAVVAKELFKSLMPVVLFNLAFGLLYPGIDNAAHVGGLMTGLAMGYLLSRPLPSAPAKTPTSPASPT